MHVQVICTLSLSLSYTVVSGEESEGEEEGEEGASGDRVLKMKQAMLEEEKQSLLQNKDMLEEVHITR